MTLGAKMEYLEEIHLRYKKANHREKSVILNEFCKTCSYHRKHAIRTLNNFKRFTKPKPKKRGRKPVYDKASIKEPLECIWLTANLPCSKRLKAIIPLWLPGYAQEFGGLMPKVINALYRISPATIDRLLKANRMKYKRRGRSTTKPGTLLRKQIPIKTNQWNERRPGFVEADTVAHCGDSTDGMYANTADFVDIATCWTEQRAVWGKGQKATLEQIKDIEESLPFPLLGFDADNGGEFLNYHLFRHFTKRKKRPIQFTRSRAYRKEDNAHIEQKNWTHVRQWIGYHRLENPRVVPLLNDLYKSEWRFYHNFFQPSVKLIEKKRVASKIIKRYDKPKTPYERVLESSDVSASVKRSLKEQYAKLNPFRLRKAMEKKLAKIYATIHKKRR